MNVKQQSRQRRKDQQQKIVFLDVRMIKKMSNMRGYETSKIQ